MSERASITINSSAGGPLRMGRLVNGVPTWQEVTEEEQAAYVPPPSDKYDLKITGVAATWKKPKKIEWIKEGGPTEDTMTRLEFEILSGKGKGRRFTSQVNCVINPRSNLGQVWMAAVGPITNSTEIMDLLEKSLTIYVERNEGLDNSGNKKVYANPTWSTAKPIGSADESADDWPAA